VEVKPAEADPVAMKLLDRLSRKARQRWPMDVLPEGDSSPGLSPVVST
jgi:hypothetical protein